MMTKRMKKSKNVNKQEIAQVVRSLIKKGSELKQSVISWAPANYYSGAGTIVLPLLTNLVQGVTVNDRVGDRVELSQLDVRAVFFNGLGAGSNSAVTHRLIVFQYLADDSKAAPVMSQLLTVSFLNGSGTYGANSDYVHEYRKMYHVLHDKQFVTVGSAGQALNGSAGGDGIIKVYTARVNLNSCQKRLQFIAGTTNGSNMLYAALTTDAPNASVDANVAFSANMLYSDS